MNVKSLTVGNNLSQEGFELLSRTAKRVYQVLPWSHVYPLIPGTEGEPPYVQFSIKATYEGQLLQFKVTATSADLTCRGVAELAETISSGLVTQVCDWLQNR